MNFDKVNIAAIREKRLQWYSPRDRGIVLKAWSGKSRRAAMHAFCLECCGGDKDAICHCTAPACPLWPYRPYQNSEVQSRRSTGRSNSVENGPTLGV